MAVSPINVPVMWSFDDFFVVSLNKQSSCWWFKMPWCSCDITVMLGGCYRKWKINLPKFLCWNTRDNVPWTIIHMPSIHSLPPVYHPSWFICKLSGVDMDLYVWPHGSDQAGQSTKTPSCGRIIFPKWEAIRWVHRCYENLCFQNLRSLKLIEVGWHIYQSGTKPNLVAKILPTKFGFVPDCICISKLVFIGSDNEKATLSEPMLTYCQLDPKENISMKFLVKIQKFHLRKCICKSYMLNFNHLSWPGPAKIYPLLYHGK